MHKLVLLPVVGTMACWGGEPWTPPEGATPWRPTLEAPPDWTITTVESPHACPDGTLAVATVVAPADPGDSAYDLGLIVVDGSFDYVLAPDLTAPLAGTHFQDPSRLDHAWALRQSWAAAGLYRSGDASVEHSGALAVALARRGAVVVVPSLCWGDYGQGFADTASTEGFRRLGSTMVQWAWSTATTDPSAMGLGAAGPDQAVLIGLGEGGRGAAEIMRAPLRDPDALLVDSVDDNLSVYWNDSGAWADRITGLDRIYPGGESQAAGFSLEKTPLPTRTALLHSSVDPRMPAGAIDPLITVVQGFGGQVVDTQLPRHVQSAGDAALADEWVGWLLGDDGSDTDP